MALLFPMNPPRALHLTSPLSKGRDVTDLQKAINLWNKPRHLPSVAVDGQFGPSTKHVVGITAYSEGITDRTASKSTIRKIYHPWLRSPGERSRAAKRAKQPPTTLQELPIRAAKFIGISENPAGSNRGNPFPSGWERNFGIDGEPWCGCFAGSMILSAGGHVTSRVAFCPSIKQDAEAKANGFDAWTTDPSKAGIGWLVLYCWDGTGVPEHVGIVQALGAELTAIEGNTSSGTAGSQSNGGCVARRQRPYADVVGFARPRLP